MNRRQLLTSLIAAPIAAALEPNPVVGIAPPATALMKFHYGIITIPNVTNCTIAYTNPVYYKHGTLRWTAYPSSDTMSDEDNKDQV